MFICRKHTSKIAQSKSCVNYKTHLDWPVHVRLFNTQNNLPSNSHSIEEVVDEAHIVDEGVHVAGAEHEQGGQALRNKNKIAFRDRK